MGKVGKNKTRATLQGRLPLTPLLEHADGAFKRTLCAYKAAIHHAQCCSNALARATSAAASARGAHVEYLKARPFICIVRRQKLKAGALVQAAMLAVRQVASAADKLATAEKDSDAAAEQSRAADTALTVARDIVVQAEEPRRAAVEHLVLQQLKQSRGVERQLHHVWSSLTEEKHAVGKKLGSRAGEVSVLEAKVRFCSSGAESNTGSATCSGQRADEMTHVLSVARDQLAALRTEFEHLHVATKFLQGEHNDASAALSFWREAYHTLLFRKHE